MEPSKESRRSKVQKKAGSEETTLTRHATRSGKTKLVSSQEEKARSEEKLLPDMIPDRVHGRVRPSSGTRQEGR